MGCASADLQLARGAYTAFKGSRSAYTRTLLHALLCKLVEPHGMRNGSKNTPEGIDGPQHTNQVAVRVVAALVPAVQPQHQALQGRGDGVVQCVKDPVWEGV